MTAARRGGMTLPAIASHFGKDHTTVMYAQNKVANNPRLNAVCHRIVDQLEEHYAMPTSVPGDGVAAASGRCTTLQMAALDQARNDTARRHHDEDTQRIGPAAAPAR